MSARPLAIASFAVALVAGACGGSGVEGTYSCPENTSLELRDDGTFVGIDGDERFVGTYEVEGEVIRFFVDGLNTLDGLIQDDGSILFSEEEDPCVKR